MKELNGFVEEFYILGTLSGKEYIDGKGNMGVTDPSKAKRFCSYREASNYYKNNQNEYYEHLYPQEVRITVELL